MGKHLSIACALVMLTAVSSCTSVRDDGKLIAYLSGYKWDGGKIYLMNVDGSHPVKLHTGLVDDGCPTWSPDGQKLVFVSANGTDNGLDRELNLYTINKDGSELTQLTHGPGDVYSAAWSHDGKHIVFSAGQDRGHRPLSLYVMQSDGTNVEQITFQTQAIVSDIYPAWSPDGKKIAFSSNPPNKGEENLNYSLFTVELENLEIQRLTEESQPDWQHYAGVDWSPNGKQLVFYVGNNWNGAPSGMYILDIETSQITEIKAPSNLVWDTSPRWSPNGQQIVFSSNRDYVNTDKTFRSDIYIMDADGSNAVRLTNSGNNICPDWQP